MSRNLFKNTIISTDNAATARMQHSVTVCFTASWLHLETKSTSPKIRSFARSNYSCRSIKDPKLLLHHSSNHENLLVPMWHFQNVLCIYTSNNRRLARRICGRQNISRPSRPKERFCSFLNRDDICQFKSINSYLFSCSVADNVQSNQTLRRWSLTNWRHVDGRYTS
jgi:hypothetical protein